MSDGREREFPDAVARRTGLSHGAISGALREQRERDAQAAAEMKTIEERLAAYAKLIEERWRGLSDGERYTLMGLCCRGCGSLDTGCQCWNDE